MSESGSDRLTGRLHCDCKHEEIKDSKRANCSWRFTIGSSRAVEENSNQPIPEQVWDSVNNIRNDNNTPDDEESQLTQNDLDRVAGKFQSVDNRRSLTTITDRRVIFSDYNDCLSNNMSGYCFLRVLTVNEIIRFVRALSDTCALECYKTRSIATKDWFNVMRRIDLERIYYVYRLAYWGEAAGRLEVSPVKTKNMVLFKIIRPKPREEEKTDADNTNDLTPLISSFRSLTVKPKNDLPRVNILIADNHMQVLRRISPCMGVNDWYVLNGTEDEVK